MLNSGTLPREWVAIGRLSHTQGNQGELFGEIQTDFPDRFTGLASISILLSGNRVENFLIEKIRNHKEGIVFKFSGVSTISDAEKLVGGLLVVAEDGLIPLDEGQYFHFQLTECQAVNMEGDSLGRILRIDDFGGNQLLVVQSTGGEEFWVPFSKDFVKKVDVRQQRIILDVPEELRHLNP